MNNKTPQTLLAAVLLLTSLIAPLVNAHHAAAGPAPVDIELWGLDFGGPSLTGKTTIAGLGDAVIVEVQDVNRASSVTTLTVEAFSSSDLTGETITLRRQTPNAEVPDRMKSSFFGAITFESTAVSGNGRVRVVDGDVLTVRYTDSTNTPFTDTATFDARTTATMVTDATIYSGHDLAATACSAPLGAKVTVTDTDADTTAGADGLTVEVRSSVARNTAISIALTETGATSGIFEGRLCFTHEAASDANDRIQVKDGAVVTLSYTDVNLQGISTDLLKTLLWREAGTGTPEIMMPGFDGVAGASIQGSTAYIRVLDKDRDGTSSADTLTVAVRSLVGAGPAVRAGPMTVTLTESGPNSGEFLGTLGLVTTATAGKLLVVDGDTVEASYDDPRAADGSDPAATTDSALWDQTVDGTVRLVRSDYTTDTSDFYGMGAGLFGRLYIRVEDADRNTASGSAQTIQAAVFSGLDPRGLVDFPAGGAIGIDLVETGLDTGVFTGFAPFTTDSSMTANALLVQDGTNVSVQYQDVSVAGTVAVRTDSGIWHAAETGTLTFDQASYTGVSSKTEGDYVTVTVLDLDRNVLPGTKDKVHVRVASPTIAVPTNEILVELEEVEENSGIFRGKFGLTNGTNSNSTSQLRIDVLGTFQATYSDPRDATGEPATTAPTAASWAAAGTVGTGRLNSVDFFGAGTSLPARVLYFDSDAAPVGGYKVCVTSDTNPTGINITLANKPSGSHAYEGSFGFTTGAATSTLINVADGDAVNVLAGACPGVAFIPALTATWNAPADGLIEFRDSAFAGPIAAPHREFGIVVPAFLQVNDSDAGGSSLLRDVLEVSVGGETVALIETTATSGIFRRGDLLFEATSTANNGRLGGASGSVITASYSDGKPASGSSLTLTDTLTWFKPGTVRFSETAGGSTVANFTGLRTVWVELDDPFYNTDSGSAQTESIDVLSEPASPIVGDGGAADLFSVLLTETGANTGVFRGSFVLGASADLDVGGGTNTRNDVLTARDIKATGANEADGDIVQGTATWLAAEDGVVRLTAEPPLPDTPAASYAALPGSIYSGQGNGFLQVFDPGANANPAAVDSVTVTVTSTADGTGISVTLRETLANSGIFRGRFTFTTGASSDAADALKVVDGNSVLVSYPDAKRADGTASSIGNENAVTWEETSSATLAVSKRKVGGSETLVLTLTDKDQDTSGATNWVTIPAADIMPFDMPYPNLGSAVAQGHDINLTETAATSGIFQATLSFVDGATAADNQVAVASTNGGSRVRIQYTEALDSSGQLPRAQWVDLFWYDTDGVLPTGNGNGFVQFDMAAYPSVSSTALITVTDPDPTCVPTGLSAIAVDTLSVLVISSSDGRGESITVTETGVNTKIFAGSVGFESSLVASNGRVAVATGDRVTVLYYDGRGVDAACGTSDASPFFVDRDVAKFGVTVTANPTATLSVTPTTGTAPQSVNFTVGGSDSDGIVVSYSLNFGDSTTPQIGTIVPATVEHTYSTAGTYTATVTVTDNSGLTGLANVTVTIAGNATNTTTTTTTTSSSTTTTSSSTTTTSSSSTGTTGVTPTSIQAANQRIEITVTRDGEDNLVEWTLPGDLPGTPQGVQIFRSLSPFTLHRTLTSTDADYLDGSFLDIDAPATAKYLVTVFYGLTPELGYFPGTAGTDPADVIPGFASLGTGVSATGSSGDGLSTTVWILIIVGAVVIIALVILLVVVLMRKRKDEAPEAAAQDDWGDGPAEAAVPMGTGEQHNLRCPVCATEFTAEGARPLVTNCPGCGRRGVLN